MIFHVMLKKKDNITVHAFRLCKLLRKYRQTFKCFRLFYLKVIKILKLIIEDFKSC